MKKVLNLFLCLFVGLMAMAQSPQLTVEQHLEDFDFAVKYIEDNYSGFSFWVNDSTRSDYEETKSRLRGEVERGERPCWDAVAAYTGWFNDLHLYLSVHYNGLNQHSYHQRHMTSYASLMEEYEPKPVAIKVTDKTFLVRFPSCGGDPDMKWIKKSIKQYKKSHCKNLIIDLRGNTGGNDAFGRPYFQLLYDHEAILPGIEFRNTPQNMDFLRRNGWFPNILKMAADNPEAEYISPGNGLIKRKKIDRSIVKAALIIDDNVASSGESIVRLVKCCSAKTTIYGKDNTLGALDFANLSSIVLPHCQLSLYVPMSRTIGLPENSIDKNGIAPDVRIPLPLPARLTDNIDEWVIWVAEQLENKN